MWAQSKTLAEAIGNLTRYLAVLQRRRADRSAASGRPTIVAFDVTDATVRSRQQLTEFAVANLVRGLRLITAEICDPSRWRSFTLGAAGSSLRAVLRLPVRSRSRATPLFARLQLDSTYRQADHRLLAVLERYAGVLADRQPVSSGCA